MFWSVICVHAQACGRALYWYTMAIVWWAHWAILLLAGVESLYAYCMEDWIFIQIKVFPSQINNNNPFHV